MLHVLLAEQSSTRTKVFPARPPKAEGNIEPVTAVARGSRGAALVRGADQRRVRAVRCRLTSGYPPTNSEPCSLARCRCRVPLFRRDANNTTARRAHERNTTAATGRTKHNHTSTVSHPLLPRTINPLSVSGVWTASHSANGSHSSAGRPFRHPLTASSLASEVRVGHPRRAENIARRPSPVARRPAALLTRLCDTTDTRVSPVSQSAENGHCCVAACSAVSKQCRLPTTRTVPRASCPSLERKTPSTRRPLSRSSRWTRTRSTANSARASSLTFSAKQTAHLPRWTRVCESPAASRLRPATYAHMLTPPRENKDDDYLKTLSELGHFLKGSSATLGLTKVKDSCEKIQHFGSLKDEAGTKDIDEDEACKKLKAVIAQAKKEFDEVKDVLKEFYKDTP